MRKRVFVALGVALGVMLVGCGTSSSSHADMSGGANVSETDLAASYDGPAADAEEVGPASFDPEVDEPLDGTKEYGVDEDLVYSGTASGRIPDDMDAMNAASDGETAEELEVATTSPADAEGIIVLEFSWYHENLDRNIYCLDPTTGEATFLCGFPCNEIFTSEQVSYRFWPETDLQCYSNYYDAFSEDYSKAVLTKDLKDGNSHAGWIDTNGVFFDVTEALVEAAGDFDDAITWRSVGFQGDTFIYLKDLHSGKPYEYYGVDINNIKPGASYPIEPTDKMLLKQLPDGKYNYYRPTSWIDDIWFYGEDGKMMGMYESVKVNSQTGETQQYIPGSSRYNWNAVLSPDGQYVAFLSTPKESQFADLGLYIMPTNGDGEPQKLQTDVFYDYAGAGLKEVPQCPGSLGVSYHILEWK